MFLLLSMLLLFRLRAVLSYVIIQQLRIWLVLLGSPAIHVGQVLEILPPSLSLREVVLAIEHIWAHYLVKILLTNKPNIIPVKTAFVFLMHLFIVVHH